MSAVRILTEDQAFDIAENAATTALNKFLESHGFKLVQIDEQSTPDEKHQTVNEIANHTGMHPITIRKMAKEGTIPSYRAGVKISFKKSEVDKALAISKRGQKRK